MKKKKSITIRERTPVEIILYSVFLYLTGLSFRRVSSTIKPFIKRSRTFVWEWGSSKSGKRVRSHIILYELSTHLSHERENRD